MFAIFLTFLKSHLQMVIIASGIASVLATISIQHLEIRHLQNKLGECHAESNTLENSNKALLASIADQNHAIMALQAFKLEKESKTARALSAARAQAQMYYRKAGSIEGQAVSKGDCADLHTLLNQVIGNPR